MTTNKTGGNVKRRKRQRLIQDSYQAGFDTGARWGYNTGRMDERYGRPKYAGIKNVVSQDPAVRA